jgi:ATP-dependent exoDNAse (exonuclease V) beta subunit
VSKDGHKDNSMQAYVAPLFAAEKPAFAFKDTPMHLTTLPEAVTQSLHKRQLMLVQRPISSVVSAVISPSGHGYEVYEGLNTLCHAYGKGLDLSALDAHLAANEIGTWMHRLYQVALKQPSRLDDAMKMSPVTDVMLGDDLRVQIKQSLSAFCLWLAQTWQPIQYHCELPTLSINELGQTVSGTIDLLLETEKGYWIVDHKTDKIAEYSKHHAQLMAYAQALKLDKPVLGLAVHWVRFGCVEL